VFNVKDRILVKSLYKFKGTELKNNTFRDKAWTINGLNYQLKKLRDTGTTARQPGSGRRQSARTVENVDTVNDLILSHKCILKYITYWETVEDRWIHAAMRSTSIESSFHPCNIYRDCSGAYPGKAKMCFRLS